jgi:hypothetical protein
MKRLLILAAILAALPALAGPFAPSAPSDASGTIAVTSTYQQVWAFDANRLGCTIQNNGSNAMTVRVGGSTGSVWSLPVGQTFYCHWQGTVITSKIEITGTAADAFAAAAQ